METQTKPAQATFVRRPFGGASSPPINFNSRAALWSAIRSQNLAEITFRENYPIAHMTVDFFAHEFHLVVSVSEPGVSPKHWAYAKQDAQLRHLGYRVLRFTHEEIRREMPLVLDSIVEVASQIARKQRKI